MKIVSLQLENFRRYDDVTIDFPEGLIGIVGPNGAGKSTIIEALGWCLYGNDAARTKKDEIKRTGASDKNDCKVTAELILGSDAVRIERSLHGKNLSGNAVLFLNSEPNASVTGMREVSDYISTRTGMDHIAFFISIFAKQKELAALSNLGKADRKKTILRLLRIDKIEDVISLIRSDIRQNKKMLEFLHATLKNMDDLQSELERLQQEKSLSAEEITKIKTNVAALKKSVDAAQQKFSNLEQKYKQHQQIYAKIEKLVGEIDGTKKQKISDESDLASSLESQQKLTEVKPQLEQYKEITKKKQELDSLKILYTEKSSLQKQYEEYDQQIVNKTKENEKFTTNLKSYQRIDEKLDSITQKLTSLQQNHDEKSNNENKIQSEIEQQNHQKTLLERELEEIRSLGEQSLCPKCKRPLGKHATELSKYYETEIQQLQNSINSNVMKKAKLSSEIKVISDNIKAEQNNEIEIKKKIEERNTLQIRSEEGTKTISSLKSQQSKISTKLEKYSDVHYDEEKHSQVVTQFQKLDEINKTAIALAEKAKAVPILKKRIESIAKRIFEMDNKILNYKKQLDDIGFNEQQYDEVKKSKSDIESNYHQQREKLIEQKQKQTQIDDKISQQKQTIKDENERQKLQKEADNKLSILVLLEEVMIEFKMDLISRIKPQLSSRTSELFRQMTNGKYSSIELDDDYTIMINDSGQNHPIERFSGGETDLANLCLRIAISQELSQRTGGSKTQFIALDEIFGSQDEARKISILQALQGIAKQFRQILLITHVEDVKESLPYVLNVKENSNNTVTIEVEGK